MLHELCRNAHGPHNANFYKLWDELRKECEELMSKGITGSGGGFDLPRKRLAEKRARLGYLLPSGPKRLGGDSSIMAAVSPIQAAAMDAERRLQDDIWCGSQAFGDGGSNLISQKTVYTQYKVQETRSCLVVLEHMPQMQYLIKEVVNQVLV
ncbi:hypothetical protein Dsin_022175 [Dipteronia sinensis]|uniref:WLM domain-containing protein n=1 Tax=Dipteronia sinensis TaxID=43782 RepID=A0AAE0DZI2_9ROSI|nr:hypothetical protein Dsin_022175 [Dipteronia sinensis]